ncbi:MAG: cytidylyltransferase family protein [Desulfurococcales archaeon]|nr:cytidylyltransferase family protein [Desulfurococcales archaeon]
MSSVEWCVGKDEIAFRIKKYIDMVEKAVTESLEGFNGSGKEKEVLELAKLYLSDSKHYFNMGDYVTALACISYAEGLLDSLRILGYVKFEWRKSEPKKVFVGGTFDLIHPGHIHYLKEASKYGLVYAVVARDRNVLKVKGRKPILDQTSRLRIIESIKYVYRAFLGDEYNIYRSIEEVRPDIIILGPDQPLSEESLIKELEKRGISCEVLRLSERVNEPLASSTNIIKEVLKRYCTVQ